MPIDRQTKLQEELREAKTYEKELRMEIKEK